MNTLREDLEKVSDEDRCGWSVGALCDRVIELAEHRERVDAELARAVGQWDQQQGWAASGLHPAQWLTAKTPMRRSQARKVVACARLVRDNEHTGSRWQWEISPIPRSKRLSLR
jgi:hypothetical protein